LLVASLIEDGPQSEPALFYDGAMSLTNPKYPSNFIGAASGQESGKPVKGVYSMNHFTANPKESDYSYYGEVSKVKTNLVPSQEAISKYGCQNNFDVNRVQTLESIGEMQCAPLAFASSLPETNNASFVVTDAQKNGCQVAFNISPSSCSEIQLIIYLR